MSLLKEYDDLDKVREEEKEKSLKHYASLNVPGTRTMGVDALEARKRIEAMKAERAKPNHE